MTLPDLLTYVGINNWDRALWFKGAELKADVLIVTDSTIARYVKSCWLSDMQQHIPALRVIVREGEPVQKPKGEKPSIWNKRGREHHAARLGGID